MVSAKRAEATSTLRRSKRACVVTSAAATEAVPVTETARAVSDQKLAAAGQPSEVSAAETPKAARRSVKGSRKPTDSVGAAKPVAQATLPEPNTDEAAVEAAAAAVNAASSPGKPSKSPKRRRAVKVEAVEEGTSAAAPDALAAADHAPAARRKKPKAAKKAAPAPAPHADANGDHDRTPAEQLFSPVKAEASDAEQTASPNDDVQDKPKKPRAKSAKQIRAEEARVAAVARLEKLVANPEERIAEIMASRPRKWIGAHVSASGGVERAPVNAAAVGAHAFALDTKSKRRWDGPPLTDETVLAFKAACLDFGFLPDQILPHGSYLINLASSDPELKEKSYAGMLEELKRCERLGIQMYNFHPGSTCGKWSTEEGIAQIAALVNRALAATSGVTIVLENTAGQGSCIGHRFEQLADIIHQVDDKSRVGVCLDTCHLFAAGYDVSTAEGLDKAFEDFDRVIGRQYLRGMHVNDSKAKLSSKRDLHQNIGRGEIGPGCFERLMADPRLDGLPLIMETPAQSEGPPIDFVQSLQQGAIVLRKVEEEVEEATDKRDVRLLYSYCN